MLWEFLSPFLCQVQLTGPNRPFSPTFYSPCPWHTVLLKNSWTSTSHIYAFSHIWSAFFSIGTSPPPLSKTGGGGWAECGEVLVFSEFFSPLEHSAECFLLDPKNSKSEVP